MKLRTQIADIKKLQPYTEKVGREANERKFTDYGEPIEERYICGEKVLRVAGINCSYGN